MFQFLLNVIRFLDCCLGKYHKLELLNFGRSCGNILKVLLYIYIYIYIRCYIMKVIAMSLVYYYLGHNVGDISGHHCRRGK